MIGLQRVAAFCSSRTFHCAPRMTKRKHYDVAIIGMGTMGSFAAVELAKRGLSVVGFDQFTPPHGRGSHSGGTRVYRIAYPEGTGYVQLAQRAGELWDQAAEQLGTPLLHRTGMLYMGHPGEAFIREIVDSASINRLDMETLSADDVYRVFPAFEIPENHVGLFDAQAGWLDVDSSITRSHAQAAALGVECCFDRPVESWRASATEASVQLENHSITAASLVITAGSWTGSLLRDLQLPLTVKRKVIAWFDPMAPELFAADRIPVFTFAENLIYGFPNMPGLGVKLAEHLGGSYLADADSLVTPPGPADLDPMAAIAAKYMPKLLGRDAGTRSRMRHSATCLYTTTPDEDFIVDHHPEFHHVVFAAGFSGHGFKFAPLIAAALADLVEQGKTSLPIDFLSLDRFSSGANRSHN
jgi:monomeric sarcosine oxidase